MRLAVLLSCFLFVSPCVYAQWQAVKSPVGAQIRELQASDTRIFAATFSGLYFSDDGGLHWTNAFSGPYERGFVNNLQVVGPVVICRIRSLETGDFHIFISENSGDDWRDFPLPNGGSSLFRNLAYNGQALIYQVAGTVLFVSFDLGETWEVENQATLPFVPNNLKVANGQFFVVDPEYNLWRGDSTFQSWEIVPLDLEPGEFPRMYVDGDLMLAGIPQVGVRYSFDGGMSWNDSPSFPTWSSDNESFWTDGDDLYTIHWGDVYQSQDQGVNWTQLSPLNSDYKDIVFVEDKTLLAEDEAVYQSPDFGHTLTHAMEGLQGLTILDFTLEGGQMMYYNDRRLRLATVENDRITGRNGVLGSISLDELDSGDGYYYINEYTPSGNPYKHRLYRVAPDGSSTFIHGSTSGAWLVNDHMKYEDDKLLYFNTSDRIYSTDNGDSWQPLNTLSDGGEAIFDYVRHGDAVFTVGVDFVKRLRDGESNWETVSNGLNLETLPIGSSRSGARLISTPGALFFYFARQSAEFLEFFVSHDNGDTWQEFGTDLPDIIAPYLNSPLGVKNIVALGPYHVMALRDVGIVISTDQGLSWTVYNDGLPTDVVNHLALYDGRLLVGTQTHGFWELGEEDIRLQAINGQVFFDENSNGTFETNEPLLPNVKLLLADESDLAFTNQEGVYQLAFVNDSAYGPVLDNPYLASEPGQRNTDDAGALDFAVQLTAPLTDFCVDLYADQVHRPGFPTRYYLKYQNLANTVSSASLQLTYYDFLQFESATQTPSEHMGNQLSFDLGELPPLASGTIVIAFTMDISAPLGAEVLSTLTAQIAEADANSDNNTAELKDIVVGSYDPNDIQVNLAQINPTQVANEIELEYLIRFQNTGNYEADRVVVHNKITEGLNLGSINSIRTSHPMSIERSANRELAFVFDNIQLPDSTSNEAESHGFITYRVKVDPSLVLGDTIPNQAAIFFDFNPPIITNIATTTVDDFVRTRNITAPNTSLHVWPNPVAKGGRIQISTEEAETGRLLVFDGMGRCLQTHESFNAVSDELSTAGLPKGQYYLVLETEDRWYKGIIVVQ